MNGTIYVPQVLLWYASPMRIQSLNHSTYQHQYHIVWGTKYRRKILKPYVLLELKKVLYATVKQYPTLWIEALNTDDDHVHIQIEIPPNIAVSDAVGKLKSASSKHLRAKFKFIREIYIEKDGIWSVGYFSSTVGLNEEKVKKYIAWQSKKDVPQKARLF
jgi:putative transposase